MNIEPKDNKIKKSSETHIRQLCRPIFFGIVNTGYRCPECRRWYICICGVNWEE